jgi:hypothetical protein
MLQWKLQIALDMKQKVVVQDAVVLTGVVFAAKFAKLQTN